MTLKWLILPGPTRYLLGQWDGIETDVEYEGLVFVCLDPGVHVAQAGPRLIM